MHKLNGIKIGDTVRVTFEAQVRSNGALGPSFITNACILNFTPMAVDDKAFQIERIEQPLAVGDRVRWLERDCEVLLPPRESTENGLEVVIWNDREGYLSVKLEEVELIP